MHHIPPLIAVVVLPLFFDCLLTMRTFVLLAYSLLSFSSICCGDIGSMTNYASILESIRAHL